MRSHYGIILPPKGQKLDYPLTFIYDTIKAKMILDYYSYEGSLMWNPHIPLTIIRSRRLPGVQLVENKLLFPSGKVITFVGKNYIEISIPNILITKPIYNYIDLIGYNRDDFDFVEDKGALIIRDLKNM